MELPNDVLTMIINYLDPLTLLITEQVSIRWKELTRLTWSRRKTFLVDQLYYYIKQYRDIKQTEFNLLCSIVVKKFDFCLSNLQLSQFRHDDLSFYTFRGLPMSRSAMRLYLQRMNHQYLVKPRWRPLSGRCLIPPPLHQWLSLGASAINVKALCLYNVKLISADFVDLREFLNLHTLILWPTATSWYACSKQNIGQTLSGMIYLKKLKLFTILPDLIFDVPASVENFTIQLVNTVSNRDDEITRTLFQHALHRFVDEHPALKKLTVLVRPRHMNYIQLIDHLSVKVPLLTNLMCQYNFKFGALDLFRLIKLRHFGVCQNFLLASDYFQRKNISENVAKTVESNFNVEKLTFNNCHLKNSCPLPDWFNSDAIKRLKFTNIFGDNNELLYSLIKACPNLRTLVLSNVKPSTEETLLIIGDCCKKLTSVVFADDNPDATQLKVDVIKHIFEEKNLTTIIENRTLEPFSSYIY